MELQYITTTYENKQAHTDEQGYQFTEDNGEVEKGIVNLYPEAVFQTIYGFGGALTESAGYVFSKIDPQAQKEILDAYYGKDGLGYTMARTHIDSCDFSIGHYAAMDDPNDTELATFSLDRAQQYVLPLFARANEVAGKPLVTMLTPWSPPAFMKTNDDRDHGGYLREEYYPLWARYICKYIQEYRAKGIDVRLLSVQNEPKAIQIWDSCLFTAAQEREFIRGHLAPELRRAGLSDVSLLIWDHNKERAYDRARDVISDSEMDSLVDGVAVHWYSGDHFEALELIKKAFPNKRIIFSEACVEYLVLSEQNQLINAQMYAHEIIGSLNGGLDTFLDWNIILDQNGGPNHVNNYCDAPVMCNLDTGRWSKNLSYYYIGHFSKYIKPQAVRIGCSRFTQELEVTAVQNPDGSLCTVVMNPQDADISFTLRIKGKLCKLTAKAHSINTCIIGSNTNVEQI